MEGTCSLIASASSKTNVLVSQKLSVLASRVPGTTNKTLEPKDSNCSDVNSWIPCPIPTKKITEALPITIPSHC